MCRCVKVFFRFWDDEGDEGGKERKKKSRFFFRKKKMQAIKLACVFFGINVFFLCDGGNDEMRAWGEGGGIILRCT